MADAHEATSLHSDEPHGALHARVAARLVEYDHRLQPEVTGGILMVVEPASGSVVTLGIANDGRGGFKLYAGARADGPTARSLGSRLGRVLGTVQVVPVDGGSEVRRWSPYRLEDIARTPAEAADWASSTIQTLLEELRPAWSAAGTDVTEPAATQQPVTSPALRPPDIPSVAPELDASPTQTHPAAQDAAPAPAKDVASSPPAVDPELTTLRDELAQTRALLDDMTRERDLALVRQKELESRPTTGADVGDVGGHLIASLELITESGIRPGLCVAVLRQFLLVVPQEPRLTEALGIHLLRDDQVREAITTLGQLGANGLTPRGASALVEASFRQRVLPEPLDVLARVDWHVGSTAQQLREVPRWAPRGSLVTIAEIVAQSAPPEFDTYLGEIARTIGREQMQPLFDLWFEFDASGALAQLVGWVGSDQVSIGQSWAREAVRLALVEDDRRTARAALDLLAEDAERRKDAPTLLELIETARQILRPADWRTFVVQWLRDTISMTSETEVLDSCAAALLDVLREMPAVREEDPEHALAVVLERRASSTWAEAIGMELARLRPSTDVTVRDVTTVSEALQAARERYPRLVVLSDAERSAAKRGSVAVKKAREALFQLGEVAERYAAGELDQGLDEALATLPDFKPDISATAKQRYGQQYRKTLDDGRKVQLGPHFDIGGTDGRAYLYIDKDRQVIVLGHCGEHLAGKRDN